MDLMYEASSGMSETDRAVPSLMDGEERVQEHGVTPNKQEKVKAAVRKKNGTGSEMGDAGRPGSLGMEMRSRKSCGMTVC